MPSARPAITLSDWQDPANTAWSYRHVRELIPTARVRAARCPSALPRAAATDAGPAVQRLLDDEFTDGLIVLHEGEVVLEEYRRGMRPDDVHLLQSVSKSITGILTGVLIGRGALAAEDPVTAHVSELEGTSFDGASVRDLLDMRAGTAFNEDYDDPDSDVRASEAQFGWAPGPRPASDAIAYLSGLANHRPHGGPFEYRSILSDVLGLVLERASGAPFAETLGRELWSPIGAETDAQVTLDPEGFAVADGGICVSLRDLARFGRMVLDGGTVGGLRVVAEEWLTDTFLGGEDSADAFAQGEERDWLPGGHYRSQWWVPAGGQCLLAIGIHGQFLFVDRPARTVIALLSTWPTPLDDRRSTVAMEAFRATAETLRGG